MRAMRRSTKTVLLVLGVSFLASCTDGDTPTGPSFVRKPQSEISDGARAGYADFLWLPPTVPAAPTFTAPFDATTLNELRVEVCAVGVGGTCAGDPLDVMTAAGTPAA